IFPWAEYPESFFFKNIYHAAYQRIVHSYNGKVNLFFFGKSCQLVKLHCADRYALCHLAVPSVARSAVNLFYFRALGHLPGNGMFSSAASDNQYFHWFLPLSLIR